MDENKKRAKYNVLIIDDERDSVTPLMMLLERQNYNVLFAENAADARVMLSKTLPDLILLDVVLGDESGFDLFQEIKDDERLEGVPILFGSGYRQGDAVLEGFKMGANDYITKPYNPREICARIDLQIQLKTQEKLLRSRNRELTQAYRKLEEAQAAAIRSEKLAAIGSMSTGIAHEMSTPLSFIISNLKMLGEYIGDIYQVLWAYQDVTAETLKNADNKELVKQAQSALELRDHLDLDTIMDELTELARENLEGAESIAKIAKDLCEFSRDEFEEFHVSPLDDLIDRALTLGKNELSGSVIIEKDYKDLPDVECVQSRITQLLLIVLLNAAQAMQDKGTITIRTRREDDTAVIEIEDQGCGIPDEHLERIFDPFFTTKPMGTGTGLGLSIAQGIAIAHGGTIHVNSRIDQGTVMSVRLPVRQREEPEVKTEKNAQLPAQ